MVFVLLVLAFCGCENIEIPVITEPKAVETSPTVVDLSAVMTSKQIDEYGVVYSAKSKNPSLSSNDGKVSGTLDANGLFTATLTLATNTTYYFVFFATNEVGTATSVPVELKTSLYTPNVDDNPFPNP